MKVGAMKTTEQIFETIMQSDLFRLDGGEIDLPARLSDLADAIQKEDETDWSLGECEDCTLADLVIGAYWALSGWIADSCFGGSEANEPYFKLGLIFSPGMASGPEPESGEEYAFERVNDWFAREGAE